MTYIVVANIIALIASLLMIVVGSLKDKKHILITQTTQIGLLTVSTALLGGVSGAIINILSCIRNICCYKDKLTLEIKCILTLASILIPVMTTELNLWGTLPIISAIIYLWLMDTNNISKFKLLLAFTSLIWFIYDIYILSYTSAIFELGCIIANLITILQINVERGTK